jgi:hypothetical protein
LFHCRAELDNNVIAKEEKAYFETPNYYVLKNEMEKERILMSNFVRIMKEMKELVALIINSIGDE